LGNLIKSFFWRPAGFISSLESLQAAHGVAGTRDVTAQITGLKDGHPLRVAELIGGKIIGDLRLVATASDIVIGGLQTLFGCPDPKKHYLFKRRRFRLTKYWKGTALLLGAANSDNYYHWMVDSMPRWKMLQAANWSDYDFVLLHSRPVPFQDEILDRLNVPRTKRLRCSKNFVHQFERLIVPSMPFPPEHIEPWAISFLRSLFPENASGPKKVYLHRGAGRRCLANEMELETALTGLGFISVDPQRLTVLEQAKLLSSAQCVVGPHGGALTNLIFTPPGALLLELFHPEHKNDCYVNMARACGHRYAGLDGHAIPASDNRMLEYTVDVPAVLRLVADSAGH
jgi:hypothetical protein